MSKPKQQNKFEKISCILFFVCLAGFFATVLYLNFCCAPYSYNGDVYSDIDYAENVWREKTIFPSGWVFGNQYYVFSTPVFAALFMGIFKNGFTAMAAATSLMTVLIFLAYNYMLRPFASLVSRLGGFLMFASFSALLGHLIDGFTGWQLFFTLASYYSSYLITACVCFGCYIRVRENKKGVWVAVMYALSLCLCFATGMQSLRQTEAMIIPLVITQIVLMIKDKKVKKKFDKKPLVTVVLMTASNIAGLIFVKALKIKNVQILNNTSDSPKPLWNDFRNMYCFLVNFFKTSLDWSNYKQLIGIGYILVALVLAVSALILLIRFFKNKNTDVFFIVFLATLTGIVGVAILLVFSKMNVRNTYFFMINLLVATGTTFLINDSKLKLKPLVIASVLLCCAITVPVRIVPAIKDINNPKHKDVYYEVSDYLEKNGYDFIYTDWLSIGKLASVSEPDTVFGMLDNDRNKCPCKPVTYICNPQVFDNPENAVYVLDENKFEKFSRLAGAKDVKLNVLYTTENSDISYARDSHFVIFTASNPIWEK